MYEIIFSNSDTSTAISELIKEHGGQWDGHDLWVDNQLGKIHLRLYKQIAGFEVALHQVEFRQEVKLAFRQEEQSMVVIRFTEEELLHSGQNFVMKHVPKKGVYMYNSLNPMALYLPAHHECRWISVRIPKTTWDNAVGGRWEELDALYDNPRPWVIHEQVTPLMEGSIKDLHQIQQKEEGRIVYSLSKALELTGHFFMSLLKRRQEADSIGILDVDRKTVLTIKEELIQDLENPPSPLELSEKYGMSLSKLRKNFKKVFGLPIHQFLLRERLQEAHRQISNTDLALTTIALSTGFSNSAHFSERFKKHYGIAPSEIRK